MLMQQRLCEKSIEHRFEERSIVSFLQHIDSTKCAILPTSAFYSKLEDKFCVKIYDPSNAHETHITYLILYLEMFMVD